MTKALRKQTEHLRPNFIPVLHIPTAPFVASRPLAYDLEARHAERSVIPEDKAVAFVCDLLEDLADEWAVKPLFLYRWWDAENQAFVSRWAGRSGRRRTPDRQCREIDQFRRRQISRMMILGATDENRPLLEESYRRILAAFEPHVGMTNYLSAAGHRWLILPGSVSSARWQPIRRRCGFCGRGRRSPITGSGAWTTPQASTANGIRANAYSAAGSRRCCGLQANSICRSLSPMRRLLPWSRTAGDEVWGLPYALSPFKYQVKCLEQLRGKFAALDAADRAALQPILARTGCWEPLAAA